MNKKITECPYCNGVVVDDRCRDCGWEPCFENPLADDWEEMDDWKNRFAEEDKK